MRDLGRNTARAGGTRSRGAVGRHDGRRDRVELPAHRPCRRRPRRPATAGGARAAGRDHPRAVVSGAFLAGVVAGYGVAVPVGAIAILIMGLTARTSLRVGAAAAMGVATADGLYAVVAVVGGAALASRHRADRRADALAGRRRAARARRRTPRSPPCGTTATRPGRPAPTPAWPRPGRAYAGLLGLTLLNPMTIVYFAALVLGPTGVGRADRGRRGALRDRCLPGLGELATGDRGRRVAGRPAADRRRAADCSRRSISSALIVALAVATSALRAERASTLDLGKFPLGANGNSAGSSDSDYRWTAAGPPACAEASSVNCRKFRCCPESRGRDCPESAGVDMRLTSESRLAIYLRR